MIVRLDVEQAVAFLDPEMKDWKFILPSEVVEIQAGEESGTAHIYKRSDPESYTLVVGTSVEAVVRLGLFDGVLPELNDTEKAFRASLTEGEVQE